MVKQKTSSHLKEEQLNAIFHALADPTRRKILRHLARQQASVGDIADPFSQSLPAISKHLKVLEKAQLIKRSRQGRSYQLQLAPKSLQKADTFISFYERFWNNKLSQLEAHLRKQK